ncbi:hypothetical protein FB451DRAFT_1402686 [Mycena latifolia]|nr:hypothetical protein FB451DRAFT_1402686 [Mycena latifolia]
MVSHEVVLPLRQLNNAFGARVHILWDIAAAAPVCSRQVRLCNIGAELAANENLLTFGIIYECVSSDHFLAPSYLFNRIGGQNTLDIVQIDLGTTEAYVRAIVHPNETNYEAPRVCGDFVAVAMLGLDVDAVLLVNWCAQTAVILRGRTHPESQLCVGFVPGHILLTTREAQHLHHERLAVYALADVAPPMRFTFEGRPFPTSPTHKCPYASSLRAHTYRITLYLSQPARRARGRSALHMRAGRGRVRARARRRRVRAGVHGPPRVLTNVPPEVEVQLPGGDGCYAREVSPYAGVVATIWPDSVRVANAFRTCRLTAYTLNPYTLPPPISFSANGYPWGTDFLEEFGVWHLRAHPFHILGLDRHNFS